VGGIGQQRHRIGRQTKRELCRDKTEVQRRADGEGAIMPVPRLRVMVRVVVVMLRHARAIMPGNVTIGQPGEPDDCLVSLFTHS
jgi:hypothetical protein